MSTTQVAFLLDEDIRDHRLWRACQQHVTSAGHRLDVTRVGDPPSLPRGTPDPLVLAWAEANARIVVTKDWHSMPVHFANHLAAGHRSSGLFVIRRQANIQAIISFLSLATDDNNPASWQDRLEWLP
jgi:hypothetical protein